ncbi:hypothetical protein [Bradyrhizobium sp. 930_D9_N1_4]|uniref:hypothetical protein n=1 Tax=Bradyrhizobium sp. 930_D9_N1_4 TaxID=3240374 RepID=UPI003F88C8B6
MSEEMRQHAERVVRFVRLANVGVVVFLAGFWTVFAIWLMCWGNWTISICGVTSIVFAVGYAFEACQAYLAATPERRPDEVMRDFERQLMHHPRNPVDPRKRRRQREREREYGQQ